MDFKNLEISTKTVMVYTNILLDVSELFKILPITKVNVPLTTKKKNPNIKKIQASPGSIISLRYVNEFKGIITKPNVVKYAIMEKKYKNKLPFTEAEKEIIKKLGIKKQKQKQKRGITLEEDEYDLGIKTLLSIKHFRNQVTCLLVLNNNKQLNVMIFNNNYKIVGCKNEAQAEECIMILWNYISKYDNKVSGVLLWKLLDGNVPRFIFNTVMINIGFKLNINIDRIKLNILMNKQEYSDRIHISKFVTTGATVVNIKMFPHIPQKLSYKCLIFEGEKHNFIYLDDIPYKKKNITKDTTILAFHSSKFIMSGRYYDVMEEDYNYILDIITKNKDFITEKIIVKDKYLQT